MLTSANRFWTNYHYLRVNFMKHFIFVFSNMRRDKINLNNMQKNISTTCAKQNEHQERVLKINSYAIQIDIRVLQRNYN